MVIKPYLLLMVTPMQTQTLVRNRRKDMDDVLYLPRDSVREIIQVLPVNSRRIKPLVRIVDTVDIITHTNPEDVVLVLDPRDEFLELVDVAADIAEMNIPNRDEIEDI
jgi:hypothetical protein